MDNSYDDIFQKAGAENGVDPVWLKAQALTESQLNPNAVNPETQATGVSQIIPATAQSLGVDPKDPVASIYGQARLMAENQKRYGNIQDATLAYHGGTDQSNWGPKTQAYAQKVSQTYQQLKSSKNMSDPADDYLETDSSQAKQPDKDVEDYLSADPKMGAAPQVPVAGGNTEETNAPALAPTAPKPSGLELASNALNAIPAGIQSGAANMLMEGGKGAAYLGNKLGLVSDQNYANVKNKIGDFQGLVKNDVSQMDPLTKTLYEGGETVPAMAATGGLASPFEKAALAAKGSTTAQLAINGAGAATQGAGIAALNPTGSNQSLQDRTVQGAEIGGGLGVGIPALGKMASGAGNALLGTAEPEAVALAQRLKNNFGIDIPAYQLSNSPTIQKAGSVLERLGLTSGNNSGPQAMQAIAKAIGAPAGSTGLTPDVMQAAKDANSAGYDQVLDNIGNVKVGDLDTKLIKILSDAETSLDANQLQPLRNLANKVLNNVQSGDVIPAQVYKDMMKRGSILDKATQSPTIGTHAQEIESALQDSMRASASPEDAAKLNDLDMKWKNMRTVEPLAAKADATGQFPMTGLTSKVNKSFKNSAYTGAGDLGDLALGARTFGLSPSSGTAENSFLLKLMTGGGAGDLAYAMHDPVTAAKVAGAAGTALATGRATGAALTSDWYKNMLMRSAFGVPAAQTSGIANPLINETVGNQNQLFNK